MLRTSTLLALLFLVTPAAGGASIFLVTNSADSGPGSLRQAILDANATPSPDEIRFLIPGDEPHTIQPTSGLLITQPVRIDGYTQPTAEENTNGPRQGTNAQLRIELDSTLLPPGAPTLVLTGDDITIRGLVINSHPGALAGRAIEIGGSRNTVIEGNFIGTDITGTVADGHGSMGIFVSSAAYNTVIGGAESAARNVISGHRDFLGTSSLAGGIYVEFGSEIVIQGNLIGLDAAGTVPLPNNVGVVLGNSFDGLVGGLSPGEGNVISGNGDGLVLEQGSGNSVLGNLVGTDVTGTVAVGNTGLTPALDFAGISVASPGTYIAHNVVSANHPAGIRLWTPGNRLEANRIGTDITGTVAMGNGRFGIVVDAAENVIGGSAPDAGNLISGNLDAGIFFTGVGTSGNRVQGNLIGVQSDGLTPLGNGGPGVWIRAYRTANNLVGDPLGDSGNIIAHNAGAGVFVEELGGDTVGNRISGNSIHSNGGLGIDLFPLGPNDNDPGDEDTGANLLQNYPVLSATESDGSGTVVHGTQSSFPNAAFTVTFFSSRECDPSGYGEGETLLASAQVNTDASGEAVFEVHLPEVPAGDYLTATATDAAGNTSEFSPCLPVGLVTVALDIQPGACPNPLAPAKKGMIPVAVPGTPDLDVRDIDPSTVLLAGVRPRKVGYADLAAPLLEDPCACGSAGGDGREDLLLHFPADAVLETLSPVLPGEERTLALTGTLLDGTAIQGFDCVRVVGGNAHPGPGFEDTPAPGGRDDNGFEIWTETAPDRAVQRVHYRIGEPSPVRLSVFDLSGRLVRRLVETREGEGAHVAEWDTGSLPSGVYFYRLETGSGTAAVKVVLVR